jgi:Tfp pilus assembly protein PilN
MRPVNLIPAEQRRGQNSPLRTGPLAYILIGALVLAFVGVTALVLTNNQISDRESEIARLEAEDAAAEAKANELAAYAQFRAMSEQRVATITSLADSRFDWERVMRELALILPDDVWLVSLNATATSSVSAGGGGGGGAAGLRGGITGPALELNGCAAGQDAVAGFVTALKDIDGVTRVGVQSSELGSKSNKSGGSGSEGGGEECRTRDFIAKFALVVAFDAAPVPLVGSEGESAVASTTETATTTSSETSESSESAGEGAE